MLGIRIQDEATEPLERLARGIRFPERAMAGIGGHFQTKWRKSFQPAPRSSTKSAEAGQPPLRHRGDFSRSITFTVEPAGSEVHVGSAGPASVRARMLQEGGLIKPKTARALAVPVSWKAYGKRPKDFSDLHYIPLKGRSGRAGRSGRCIALLARSHGTGESKKLEALFALMPSVRIKPHPWVTVDARDEDEMLRIFERQLDREAGIRQ